MKRWLGDLGIIAGLVVLYYARFLCVPHQVIADRDLYAAVHPMLSAATDMLRAGYSAWWSPHILLGFPQGINSEYGMINPALRWLVMRWDWMFVYYAVIALCQWVAGSCCYVYARTIGWSRPAALLSVVVYLFSHFTVSFVGHLSAQAPWVLLPLLLLAIERWQRRPAWPWVVVAALGIGFGLVAGHAMLLACALGAAAIYQLAHVVWSWRAREHQRAVRSIACGAVALLGGFGLGAVGWWPMWQLMALTVRGSGIPLSEVGGLHPLEIVFAPWLPHMEIGHWFTTQDVTYFGAVPVLLALCAVVRRRDRYCRFFGLAAVAAWVLAISPSIPPLLELWRHLPVARWFRTMYRFQLINTFAVALLAGAGWDALSQLTPETRQRYARYCVWSVASAIGAVVCFDMVCSFGGGVLLDWGRSYVAAHIYEQGGRWHTLSYYDQVLQRYLYRFAQSVRVGNPEVWISLMCATTGAVIVTRWARQRLSLAACRAWLWGIALATLVCLSPWLLPALPAEARTLPSPVLDRLRQDASLFRLCSYMSRDAIWQFQLRLPELSLPAERRLQYRWTIALLTANANQHFGVASADGLEAMITYRQAQWAALWGSEPFEFPVFERGERWRPADQDARFLQHLHLLSLSNVKYVTTTREFHDPRLRLLEDYPFRFHGQSVTMRLYENTTVMPRAVLVGSARVVGSDEEALQLLMDGSRDWRGEVVLETQPNTVVEPVLNPTTSRVTWQSYTPTKLQLHVDADGRGFLVLSEAYFPGWTATVDGAAAPMYRANYIMRAIPISAGAHTVELSYEPPGYRAGRRLSWITACALCVGSVIAVVRAGVT